MAHTKSNRQGHTHTHTPTEMSAHGRSWAQVVTATSSESKQPVAASTTAVTDAASSTSMATPVKAKDTELVAETQVVEVLFNKCYGGFRSCIHALFQIRVPRMRRNIESDCASAGGSLPTMPASPCGDGVCDCKFTASVKTSSSTHTVHCTLYHRFNKRAQIAIVNFYMIHLLSEEQLPHAYACMYASNQVSGAALSWMGGGRMSLITTAMRRTLLDWRWRSISVHRTVGGTTSVWWGDVR